MSAKAKIRPSKAGRRRAWVLLGVHLLIALHVAHWVSSGRTLSPLEPSEAMEFSKHGIINAGFVFFALTVASTLVLGRWFCGWACHLVALQDGSRWLLGKLGIHPRPFRSRLLVWVPLGAALYMFAYPLVYRAVLGADVTQVRLALTKEGFWDTFPAWPVALFTFFVTGFVCVYFLGAKGFCTYACPYGALFGLGDKLAVGRIRVTDACAGCGHCTAVCSSNVRVHAEVRDYGMVVDPGCMKCLDCVSVCPKDALYFGFGKGRPRGARPRRVHDFAWGEELALAAVFLAAFFTYRGLYGQVSLLLAIGVAVITAVCALALVRLLRAPDFSFQDRPLRAGGRWTRAGVVGASLMVALLAFGVHSAVVRFPAWRGEAAFARADELVRGGREAEARAAADRSYDYLAFADRVGLFDQPDHLQRLAEIDRRRAQGALRDGDREAALGAFERARGYLDRVLEVRPELHHERLRRSDVKLFLGDVPGAVADLREVLAAEPENPEALRRWEAARARGLVGD